MGTTINKAQIDQNNNWSEINNKENLKKKNSCRNHKNMGKEINMRNDDDIYKIYLYDIYNITYSTEIN